MGNRFDKTCWVDGILNNLFAMFSEMFFGKARGGCFDDKRRVVYCLVS